MLPTTALNVTAETIVYCHAVCAPTLLTLLCVILLMLFSCVRMATLLLQLNSLAALVHGAADATLQRTRRAPSKQSRDSLVRAGRIRPKIQSVAEIHSSIVVPKKRVEVPLHLYLIEQCESKVQHHCDSQTDSFIEEAAAVPYIARKSGVDMWTQVETHQVFDYDRDVGEILEVICSKTIEQALCEVGMCVCE